MRAKITFTLSISEALVKYGNYQDLLERAAKSLPSSKNSIPYSARITKVFPPNQNDIIKCLMNFECPSTDVGDTIIKSAFAKNLKDTLKNKTKIDLSKNVISHTVWF